MPLAKGIILGTEEIGNRRCFLLTKPLRRKKETKKKVFRTFPLCCADHWPEEEIVSLGWAAVWKSWAGLGGRWGEAQESQAFPAGSDSGGEWGPHHGNEAAPLLGLGAESRGSRYWANSRVTHPSAGEACCLVLQLFFNLSHLVKYIVSLAVRDLGEC